jgi:PKD repeat protein
MAMLAAVIPALIPAAAAGDATAASAQPATLYVNLYAKGCDDKGPGTRARPFCTIQAAADVVNPGQTVQVTATSATRLDQEQVTITRSGTPQHPIAFTWSRTGYVPWIIAYEQTGHAPLTFKNVHDVTFSYFVVESDGTDDGVDVIGSSGITLDHLHVSPLTSSGPMPAAISIDGKSSAITVSRVGLDIGLAYGVRAVPGARGVTVTTSVMYDVEGPDVWLNGVKDAAVTSNDLWVDCGGKAVVPSGITLEGGSTGTVENNVLEAETTNTCTSPVSALSVDAASASGVTADYNALNVTGTDTAYSWAGITYTDPKSFTTATGQGAHDVTLPAELGDSPPEGSPALDSADCSAPGELSADLDGAPRVADPLAPDSSLGNGTCHADRGAHERQDSLPITTAISPTASSGVAAAAVPATFGVTITSAATSPWNEPVSYTVSFGDGSAPVPAVPGAAASHTYATPGPYTVTVTAADSGGSTSSKTYTVYALADQPLTAGFTVAPGDLYASTNWLVPDTARFVASFGALGFEMAGTTTIDFGDGQAASGGSFGFDAPGNVVWPHTYATPGTYTATLTVRDLLGRVTTDKATITVGDGLWGPGDPVNDYHHTVSAHSVLTVPFSALSFPGCCVRGLLVNVTVTGAKKAGALIIYPDGSPRPGLAAVAIEAGRATENTAMAVPGGSKDAVDFYNSSAGPVSLDIVTSGQDAKGANDSGVGETYTPVKPMRVLSVKNLAAGQEQDFTVGGRDGIPRDAQGVVLDITASATKAAGYFVTYPAGFAALFQTAIPGARWAKGQTVTGFTLAEPPTLGLINQSRGSASFTADVVGYLAYPVRPDKSHSVYFPSTPTRLATVTIGARRAAHLTIAGKDGVYPAAANGPGTTAVLLNLTSSRATAGGSVTAYPDGMSLPGTVNLSYAAGYPATDAAMVAVGKDGGIRLYNSGSKPVTITVDLTGFCYAY